MSVDLSVNHLALFPLLRDRLSGVAALHAVGGAVEYDIAIRGGVAQACAYAIWGGSDDSATPGTRMRRPRRIAQTWEVHVLAPLSLLADDKLAELGALYAEVMASLETWEVSSTPGERIYLQPIPIEQPVIYAGGLVEFVLAYQVDLMLR